MLPQCWANSTNVLSTDEVNNNTLPDRSRLTLRSLAELFNSISGGSLRHGRDMRFQIIAIHKVPDVVEIYAKRSSLNPPFNPVTGCKLVIVDLLVANSGYGSERGLGSVQISTIHKR